MAEKKILKYNFKRPDRISKNQIRSLHFVHDRVARNFSSSVSAYMRTVVEISLENIAQISYAEFLNTVSDPTCYAAISLKPLDGSDPLLVALSLFAHWTAWQVEAARLKVWGRCRGRAHRDRLLRRSRPA